MMSINLSRERSLSSAASERALDLARRDLARLQEQMSTGRRVNRASDDAPAYAQARQMERLSNRYAQYLRSIDGAQSWADHTQDALNGLADRFAEAFERGLRTKSESFNADNLAPVAQPTAIIARTSHWTRCGQRPPEGTRGEAQRRAREGRGGCEAHRELW